MSENTQPTQQEIAKLVVSIIKKGIPISRYKGITKAQMDVIYNQSYNLYTAKKYEEAGNLFRWMALNHHIDKRAWMGIGACNQMLKQYNEAIAAYSYAAILDVDDPLAAYHSIDCHLALKNYPQALSALEAVILLSADKPEYAAIKKRSEGMRDTLEKIIQESHGK
ncbi:MAG: CesD/SycD/LcrH family type III secretion system chaperone [Verrucomicrobia bacterium RIFCSPHIGHO2_12_FULL_41_10]|nr:MAG: CesD/SycD/LcrH family type III secretion system chaperone [Verrucomicrobia bacterium RIFCSPHIGHO2_12_FULL_41_10]HLB33873.1 SycD/LcrH family type III secretion system chaperone [Chthoniobacterales bacterium]